MHESIILPRSECSRLMATMSSTLLSSYSVCDFVVPPVKSWSQFPYSWNLGWPVTLSCPGVCSGSEVELHLILGPRDPVCLYPSLEVRAQLFRQARAGGGG